MRRRRRILGHALALAATCALAVPGVAAAQNPPVIAAARDIACDPDYLPYFNNGEGTETECRQRHVSDLLVKRPGLSAILALGDIQYAGPAPIPTEVLSDKYLRSYDPSWGRVRDLTYPAPGNHEYYNPGAAAYFAYFGERAGDPTKGYYSFDIESWHLIALNSNCAEVGGCHTGSPQEQWLRADLAAHRAASRSTAPRSPPAEARASGRSPHTGLVASWTEIEVGSQPVSEALA